MAANNIQHLKHHEIDLIRWDCAIRSSCNAMPYALSWYLDAVSPQWEALILGDYDIVMPLPTKQRLGLKHYVQPFWTQQLGIFSTSKLTQEQCSRFLQKIAYKMYAMKMNHGNRLLFAEERTNLILPLFECYDSISQRFHKNTQRNIQKAKDIGIQINEIDQPSFFEFWANLHQDTLAENQILLHLAQAAQANNAVQYLAARQNGQTTAAVMLIKACERIIFLAPGSNSLGKETSAMFAIVDSIVKAYASSKLTLDFEGSQIPGVKRFYEGFGAMSQNYYFVEHLHPHWLVNLMHR